MSRDSQWSCPTTPPEEYQMPREYVQMKKALKDLCFAIDNEFQPGKVAACHKDFENACAVFQEKMGVPKNSEEQRAYFEKQDQFYQEKAEAMTKAFDEDLYQTIDTMKFGPLGVEAERCREWLQNHKEVKISDS